MRIWQIVLFGRHTKVEISLDSSYRAKRRVHWAIKPIFVNAFVWPLRSIDFVDLWQWMKHRSTTILQNHVKGQNSGLNLMKVHQSVRKRNNWLKMLWLLFFLDAHGVIFINYLEKGRAITGVYYAALLDWLVNEFRKKWPYLKNKKISSFMMTMHHLTHQTLHRQESMNWVLNRFRTHRILQTVDSNINANIRCLSIVEYCHKLTGIRAQGRKPLAWPESFSRSWLGLI